MKLRTYNTKHVLRANLASFVIMAILLPVLISCNNNSSTTQKNTDTMSTASSSSTIKPASPPSNFKSLMANVNGINIHYVIGGTGEPLLLIHGFGQNWYMWNRLLPELSKHFTVIAPDLPGLGESDKPDSRLYKKRTRAGYSCTCKTTWLTII